MSEIQKSVELLMNSIQSEAEKEEKIILENAKELREDKIQTLRDEISARYTARLDSEKALVRQDANRRAAAKSAQNKARLEEIRDKTAEGILSEVLKKIQVFTQSASYADFLLSGAKNMASEISARATKIYMRSADMGYADMVSRELGGAEVEADDSIKLGGIKADFTEMAVTADDTLDVSFENAKKEYIRSCALGF